jgi:hypothetical protein
MYVIFIMIWWFLLAGECWLLQIRYRWPWYQYISRRVLTITDKIQMTLDRILSVIVNTLLLIYWYQGHLYLICNSQHSPANILVPRSSVSYLLAGECWLLQIRYRWPWYPYISRRMLTITDKIQMTLVPVY